MNQIKILLIGICVSGILFFIPANVTGQEIEPSYEVSLQLLMGSSDAGAKVNLPDNLGAVSQQIKTVFGSPNQRLVGTFLGRVGNIGSFHSKSGLNIGQPIADQRQSFLEWSVNGFKGGTMVKGGKGFRLDSLSIQARVPFSTGTVRDDGGKERAIENYETFGLSLRSVGLQEGVPALIGTLNLSGANETIFVIMTVKAADL